LVYKGNTIGKNVVIWHNVLIRQDNIIGDNVSIGSYTEIAHNVIIEDNVRIHSKCFIPEHIILRQGCWIGPRVTFANDPYPQTNGKYRKVIEIGEGAIIGASSTIMASVGRNSLIGAGSVVTKIVPENQVWSGNPAKYKREKGNIDEYTTG